MKAGKYSIMLFACLFGVALYGKKMHQKGYETGYESRFEAGKKNIREMFICRTDSMIKADKQTRLFPDNPAY